MSVIYIAVPSKGVVNGGLTSAFLEDFARLRQKYPQHAFISPMVQDYQILPYLNEEPTWENWKNQCTQIIHACDEVWVLLYTGWRHPSHFKNEYNTSTGVAAEIEIALATHRPLSRRSRKPINVCFVDPEGLYT